MTDMALATGTGRPRDLLAEHERPIEAAFPRDTDPAGDLAVQQIRRTTDVLTERRAREGRQAG